MNARTMSIFALALLTACGGTTTKEGENDDDEMIVINNGENGSADGMTGPDLDCAEVCPEKEAECGAPEGAFRCSTTCSALTPGEVECLNDSSCMELATAESVEELCEGAQRSNSSSNGSTNGSQDGGNGGSCDFAAKCEGDELVTCEEGDLGTVTERMRCSAGCEDAECVGPPTEVTINGTGDEVDPISVEDEGTLITSVTVQGGSLEYSTELPDSVDISDDSVTRTIQSPDPGSCEPGLSLTLNRSTMGASVTTEDELPDTTCNEFASDVASDGITILLEDVPYLNIGGTVDLTMEIDVR